MGLLTSPFYQGRLAVGVLLLGSLGGCGAADEPPPRVSPGEPAPEEATSLTFVPGTVLRLQPLERADLNLAAGPPGQYWVRFALLPDRPNADPNDASLDRAEALTDNRGVATVALTAPSTPSTFTVRAAIGDLEARLPVAVSDRGYGAIIAVPNYTGPRPIEQWVASVRVGSSCADLVGFPPPDGFDPDGPPLDGALVATSPSDESPTIENVPIGPVAALSVRSGQFAYGCTNVRDLGTDEIREVRVEVADLPIQLTGELELHLSVENQHAEWTNLMQSSIAAGLDAFRQGADDDVQMLLDDMEALSTDPGEFSSRRLEHDYDAVVGAVLTETTLLDRARAWLEAGIQSLDPLVGRLSLRNSSATFQLLSASGVEASQSGFLGTSTWTAFSNPGDTLVFGGALRFQPTQWVIALGNRPALAEFAGAVDAAEALVRVADCSLIGANLAAAGEGLLYPGCDASCAAALCEAAIVSAWARAGDTGGELVRLSIGVTGTAQVDDHARPVSLVGTWLGTMEDSASALDGSVEGFLVDDP